SVQQRQKVQALLRQELEFPSFGRPICGTWFPIAPIFRNRAFESPPEVLQLTHKSWPATVGKSPSQLPLEFKRPDYGSAELVNGISALLPGPHAADFIFSQGLESGFRDSDDGQGVADS